MTTDNDDHIDLEFDHSEREPSHGRHRIAVGIGAAMLVAAAGGIGFGIGRSIDDRDDAIAPLDQPAAELTNDQPDAPDGDDAPNTLPDVSAPVEEPVSEPVEEPADEPEDVTEEDGAAADASFPASGGGGWASFGDESMELLTERVTESGVIVRAHLGQTWEDEFWGGDPSGWEPAGWCFESGQVRIALAGGESTGPSIIDTGAVSWWSEPYKGRAVSSVTLGRIDGNPHRVVFVQAPEGTTSVTATFGDGSTDTTTPENGVAVLVVPGAPETIVHDEGGYSWLEEHVDVTVDFAGGVEPISVEATQVADWDDPEFRASCSPPPPALPEPGEQPADPESAENEIVELMATIYGENDTDFDTTAFIDDPTGVQEARDLVSEGSFEEAAASAEAIVEELVFTTPTDAWFRYRIETTTGIFDQRFGQAVLVDGIWKITRATICQDLGLAGGPCEPYVDSIFPPGN